MFRRIVSNLAFSPALVGQLGFYAKRLRKEESTRRLGLVFTALALIVQSLAVFSPPEAANAATPGQVGSAPRCTVDAVGPRASAFTVNANNKAVVSFDVSGGKACKVQVSVNTFFAPSMDGHPYEQQILHDRTTRTFDTPGRYAMQADLPNQSTPAKGCYYQADLTYGTHNVLPVLAYDHGKLNCGVTVASASCTSLNIIQATPTRFTLRGNASATKATINKYVFAITKPNGQTVEKVQATGATTASVVYEDTTPGTYNAKLTVYSSVGQDSGPACKGSFTVAGPATPTASCSNVAATITNRTQAYFTGSAAVSGGATITGYTFIVKNAHGVEVKRVTVPSSATTAGTSAVDIPNAGDYSVQLIVHTSLGDKTNTTSCVKPFTIAPPSVCQYNPTLPPTSPDCQPCEDNPTVWIKDEKCAAVIINTKTATNMTQGNVNAMTVTARAGDKLSYTITVQNKGLISQSVTMQEDLADVLEYSTLVDQGGGQLNAQTKTLTWPVVTLAAGQKQSRTLAVQVMNDIPSTNTGTGILTSYDCKMANTFGNTIMVGVDCPPQKVVVEQVTGELPHTGPRENMIFAGLLLAVVVYFYARSRQLGTEVRLIRRNLNTGTI
jgi:hypothetical protein